MFTATADTMVNLSSTSGGGTFLSGVDGTTVISNVTISNGTSTATFYYNDSLVGNPTITGASGLLTSAMQSGNGDRILPPSFLPGSIARLSDGNISIAATSALGTPYRLWATTNVALRPVIGRHGPCFTAAPSRPVRSRIIDLTATNFFPIGSICSPHRKVIWGSRSWQCPTGGVLPANNRIPYKLTRRLIY